MADSQNDPVTGIWKLKSRESYAKVPSPQTWIHYIEAAAGSIKVREEIVAAIAQQVTSTLDSRFDGKDYPVHGSSRRRGLLPANEFPKHLRSG